MEFSVSFLLCLDFLMEFWDSLDLPGYSGICGI